MANRTISAVITTILVGTASVASASEPLDFNYRIAGDAKVRPVLVFNDGKDVFIQPNPETAADIKIIGANAEREGPYYVIRGLSGGFSVQVKKGGSAAITYSGERAKPQIESLQAKEVGAKREEGKGVKVSVEDTQKERSTPACEPTVERKESAFIVSFSARSTKLSSQAIKQLKQALNNAGHISRVEITAEAPAGADAMALERVSAIRAIVDGQRIDSSLVHSSSREATGIGSELRVVRESTIPCVAKGVTVSFRDSDHVTIASKADAKLIVTDLAREAGLQLTVEGSPTPIPILITEINRPLLAVLESIGTKLGDKADLIYRGKSLVLSYRALK